MALGSRVGSGTEGNAAAVEFEGKLVRAVAAGGAIALSEVVEAVGRRLRKESIKSLTLSARSLKSLAGSGDC